MKPFPLQLRAMLDQLSKTQVKTERLGRFAVLRIPGKSFLERRIAPSERVELLISIGYHMRGEVISVLSLERRYHILSRVSAANEGQNMIS